MLEGDTSGCVLSVNLETRRVVKILDGLAFPNGLALSADGQRLLVSITKEYKIFIISFRQARDAAKNGVKITNPSVLIDNLLGFPNNIELISNELVVAIPIVKDNFDLSLTVAKYSLVNK